MAGHTLKVRLDEAHMALRDAHHYQQHLAGQLGQAREQNAALWHAVEHLIATGGGGCLPGRVTPTNYFDGSHTNHAGCESCQQLADLIHTRGDQK